LIAIVLAILALAGITDLWPCAAAAALYGFNWRAVLAIIDAAAIRLGCLTVNPSGAGGASSSSSGLMSGAGDRSSSGLKYNGHARITGLGDVIKVTTSAMGIQPCTGCKERARQLNRLVPSVTDDVR
jgi:hypothetical protein